MNKATLRQWGWTFLTIPYLKPAVLGVLEGTELLETAFDLWRLLAAVVVCGLYGWQMVKYRKRPSPVLMLLCVYLGLVLLGTVARASNTWSVLNYVVTIVTFCMLIELSLREGPETTLDMLVYPLTVLVFVNFVLLCVFPWGLCNGGTFGYSYNFLGIDNFLAPILIPYMFLVCLRSTIKTGDLDWFAYAMIVLASVQILLVWSATGLMGLAVALVFLLFFYQRRWETLFNFTTALLAEVAPFFGIVIFRLQNLFAFFIEDVLHKGLSFTGRTDIWDRAIEMFLQSPFLGYGLGQAGKVYRLRKGKYYHGHNALLEVAVEGGFFAIVAYLLMLSAAGRQLLIYRRHPYACLISAGLMSCFFMMTMESFLDTNGLLIYGLIFLGYHIGTVIGGEETGVGAITDRPPFTEHLQTGDQ